VGTVSGFRIQACSACRTLFTDRLPTDAEAEDYAGYYSAENLEVPEFVHRRLGDVVASFDRFRHLNRWLDVGSEPGR
jgi:hypothetical protein